MLSEVALICLSSSARYFGAGFCSDKLLYVAQWLFYLIKSSEVAMIVVECELIHALKLHA